jgi:hypothetical protein
MKKIRLTESQLELLKEIDWEGDFSDVKTSCIKTEDIVQYLNRVRANAKYGEGEYNKREKFNLDKPFVHAKSSFFKGDWKSGDYSVDIQDFIERITMKPSTIIGQNEKIEKSGGKNRFFYKTGVPAIKGIVYDLQNEKFHYINTCPGAGACMTICYAIKGRYIQYAGSYDKMTQVLNYLLNFPEEYGEQLYNELKNKAIEHKALKGYKNWIVVRWNDSGDFFSKRMLELSVNAIARLQEEGYNITDYAYTKMADVALSGAIKNTTFSTAANKQQRQKINLDSQKVQYEVPRDLGRGLDLDKYADEEIFKKRVSDYYKIPLESILTYDEMMSIKDKGVPKYNALITSNDGDDAAERYDIKAIYILLH